MRSKLLAADVQQFYCFEVLLVRLATSANIVGSAQAQFVKERQNSIIASLLFLELVSFVSTIAFAYNQLHLNYGQYNKI